MFDCLDAWCGDRVGSDCVDVCCGDLGVSGCLEVCREAIAIFLLFSVSC